MLREHLLASALKLVSRWQEFTYKLVTSVQTMCDCGNLPQQKEAFDATYFSWLVSPNNRPKSAAATRQPFGDTSFS